MYDSTLAFMIDGIDRLGKSTLIDNILNELGYHLVVHYEKPKKLDFYTHDPLFQYQLHCNRTMFFMINEGIRVIFDRTHLGECVYAPLYRNYDGDYVFNMEKMTNLKRTKLILLTTSNFDILTDDGESFDWSNKEKEQELFIQAFNKSLIPDKCIIDVHNGNRSYKDPKVILKEALKI